MFSIYKGVVAIGVDMVKVKFCNSIVLNPTEVTTTTLRKPLLLHRWRLVGKNNYWTGYARTLQHLIVYGEDAIFYFNI